MNRNERNPVSQETHETNRPVLSTLTATASAIGPFGGGKGLRMLFCQHFTGTMDNWDPIITNTLKIAK
jgi:hypothetical protein